jgi:hypothetical protein
MKKKTFRLVGAVVAGLVLGGQPAWAGQAGGPQAAGKASGYVAPYNVVVIVLDTSRSFQVPSRQPGVEGKVLSAEALGVVQQFFRDGANQKRRRTEGQDRYYLVAADAASQLIWSGTREQLAELTPDVLAGKLAIRKQFAGCTDLEAALNAAAAVLRKQPQAAEMYVLTFSDLLHEPPRGDWSTCAPPSGEPPAGIDWDTLGQARLGFYFVSKDYRFRPDAKWRTELERLGLRADFLDAAQTLTERVALTPPAPATYKPTQAQVEAAQGKVNELKGGLLQASRYVAGIFGLGVVGVMGWIVLARRRRR